MLSIFFLVYIFSIINFVDAIASFLVLNEHLNSFNNGQLISLSTLFVYYAKDREEPIKLNKPQVPVNISPWFITGFVDAEGCFDFSLSNSKTINNFTVTILEWIIENWQLNILILLFYIKSFL
jgi:hypothetical protein